MAMKKRGKDRAKRPKVSQWIQEEVMLPILGKNKTSLLHSTDQLQAESIAHQRPCINRPYERDPAFLAGAG